MGAVQVHNKRKGKYIKKQPIRTGRIILVLTLFLILAVLAAFLIIPRQQIPFRQIVRDGYSGTQEQWLASLVGEQVNSGTGQTAYMLACENGYDKSESVWIHTLTGVKTTSGAKSMYALACENGFNGTLTQWLTHIAENPGILGKSAEGEEKTSYELACEFGFSGTFIEWIVSVASERVFE